ncbi:MAG: hypothetical protein GX804_08850, partial [Lentisphaerae bacterium]|nr:hypothetical protein [Lentisphaerota bacterium]
VLSDGFLNEQLADRAKTREQGDIIILPGRFATDAQLDAFEKAVQKLGNAKLEAAASLGSAAFALTWMTEQPDIAQKNLMLFSSPSLARLAGFVPIPASLGYVLEKPENVTSNALDLASAKYLQTRDLVGEMLIITPDGEHINNYKRYIAAQTSMVGNNLGVLLYENGQTSDALEIFIQASAIDRNNMSALMNKATVVREGIRPEMTERFAKELNERIPSIVPNWGLAGNSGYVLKPEYFLEAGWVWAFSGIGATDTGTMARAVATIESEEVRNALARQLPASINIQIGGVQPLLGLLNTYPDEGATWDYYIKIANLLLVSGDAMRAGRAVDKAGTFPDADSKVVALSGADVLRRLGRHNEAAEMLLKAKTDENAADLLKKSALIYAELRDNEKLLDTVRNLSGLDPSNEWLKLMEKSVAAFAAEDIVTAKEFSDKAIEAGADAEFAFHHALWLDLLADDKIKGVEHADAALRLNALNTFANYIKATAFMRAKQYQEAERHFQLSISQNAPWFVVNDYAVLAAETGRFDLAEMLARNAIAAGGGSQASAWDTLGTALAGAGKKKEALEALQKAMTLPGADDPRIQLSFAELSLESGDRESAEKAIPVIDKGVELLSIAERERLGKLRRSLESGKP